MNHEGERSMSRMSFAMVSLSAFAVAAFAVPTPIVELKFESGSGTTPSNTGSTGGTGTMTATKPTWSTNAPANGTNSLDFGSTSGNYAVDITSTATMNALKSLKSFTITGWVNCRNATTGYGGARIATWFSNGTGGVDLAFQSDGRLGLGVDQWNDLGGVTNSSAGKITVDANGSFNNWRYFAVTYDETLTADHVKFYFGTNSQNATLDDADSYDRGPVDANVGPSLSIGNLNTSIRTSSYHSVFRGLIDQVRIYGSTANGTGALSLEDIITVQNAATISGTAGILYEEWTGIAGTTVASLTGNSNYPSNPSATLVRTTFDGFQNRGDNLGVRMSGWVQAPTTGNFTFWIASDDNGELRLSTDANPVNKRLIASVGSYTAYQTWTTFSSQQSTPIALTAGQYYYVEALMKEGTGGDHLSVGWQLPSGALERPIPAGRLYLAPPDGEALFPSAINLYEQGTSTKKATVGWHKETGNSHLYIDVEGVRNFKIQNNETYIPNRLLFGGQNPSDLRMGFSWQPSSGVNGALVLEAQEGSPVMRVESTQDPLLVEFNERFGFYGDASTIPNPTGDSGWTTTNTMHYMSGLIMNKAYQDTNGPVSFNSQYDGIMLRLYNSRPGNPALFTDTTELSAGVLRLSGGPENTEAGVFESKLTNQNLIFSTLTNVGPEAGTQVYGDGIVTNTLLANTVSAQTLVAADMVTTPKWRIPDYVFEPGYKRTSLEETEAFVRKHKHLPDIPSAKEIKKYGMNMAEMNVKLLKTVEELTLHMIDMKKELDAQKRELSAVKQAGRSGK